MTIAIVIITSIVSIIAFNNPDLFARLQFNPYQVYHRKEFYRLFTHGLLHADWMHLIVNMIVLFSFGIAVEGYFDQLASGGYLSHPELSFLILYVTSVIVSSLVTLFKHKDNAWYNSVGASGAVSAVLFTSIFFAPMHKVLFYAILPIPGIIFGILYLVYSQYMSRRNRDNINHDAHFVGAVFGFIFPLFIDPRLFSWFISQVFH